MRAPHTWIGVGAAKAVVSPETRDGTITVTKKKASKKTNKIVLLNPVRFGTTVR